MSAGVEDAAQRLVAEQAGADLTTFLGAQYDAGLAWVHFPEGLGGLGLSPAHQVVVDEVLESAGRSASWQRNPMGIGMVAPAIAAHGRPDQLGLLRRIFTGEDVWCQLFSEPGAGSDVASLATRARRTEDGEWRLTGSKVWTSLAHASRYGLALARTDPDAPKHAGLSAYVVDMAGPGVTVAPLRDLTGASHFNEVFFDDAELPASALLGEVGDGWRVAITMLMAEREVIGASPTARGEGPVAVAVDAWWRSPHRTPGERLRLARLWAEAELLRLASLRERNARLAGTAGAEGAKLKLARAELDQRLARFAVEAIGPASLEYDADLGGATGADEYAETITDPVRAWLQSQAYTIAGGTSDVLRTLIADRVLGLPREPGVDPKTPWSDLPR